jgi:hypothetical protein
MTRAVIARPMFRWVAAAAAAGLLVGVSAGRFFTTNERTAEPAATVALAPSKPAPPVQRPATYQPDSASPSSDEAFLVEVEAAVTRQRIAALSALDDLTPHARETVMMARAR